MTPHAKLVLAKFDEQDKLLVKAGFPATSPWWRTQIRRFNSSGRRRWAIRAGRRAGKSSTLCRLAYVEARWGKHSIPPGDTGFVMFVSRDRDEASQRLRTIDAIAKAVGDKLEARGDERLFPGRRTGCKVYTASIAGVSGPTSILVIGDEVAKWRDADTNANPATEVIASAMPTLATQREARAIWSSSPMGTLDAHATMVAAGDTRSQMVSIAATWEANPTITEADTHELEPDERIWKREYAAIPQAGALSVFDEAAVDRAIGRIVSVAKVGQPVMVLDPSSGRVDSWTWAVVRWVEASDGRELLRFDEVNGFPAKYWAQGSLDAVVNRVTATCKSLGIRDVHSDQREAAALASQFRSRGLHYAVHNWTAASKPDAVERVRRWLQNDQLILPAHDIMRRELLNFEERVAPTSGAFTFGARGSGHDDYVSLLITAALADVAKRIRSAKQGSVRTIWRGLEDQVLGNRISYGPDPGLLNAFSDDSRFANLPPDVAARMAMQEAMQPFYNTQMAQAVVAQIAALNPYAQAA